MKINPNFRVGTFQNFEEFAGRKAIFNELALTLIRLDYYKKFYINIYLNI